jgi:succinate-acetate transporter protein
MEDLPRRLAELLETVATRVRAMTIDRIARGVTVASLAIPLVVFALLAVIFLLMTIHSALAIPLTDAGAFGVMAGLFAIGGALAWRKRSQNQED